MIKGDKSYLKASKIQKTYQVSASTLRRWGDKGKIKTIRTIGGARLYKLSDVKTAFGVKELTVEKTKVCYAQVSSANQLF